MNQQLITVRDYVRRFKSVYPKLKVHLQVEEPAYVWDYFGVDVLDFSYLEVRNYCITEDGTLKLYAVLI